MEMVTLIEKPPGKGFTWARKPQIPGDRVRGRIAPVLQGFPGSQDEAWLEAGAPQQVGSWGHPAAFWARWDGRKRVMPVRAGKGHGML